jgi:hypothetical protein
MYVRTLEGLGDNSKQQCPPYKVEELELIRLAFENRRDYTVKK